MIVVPSLGLFVGSGLPPGHQLGEDNHPTAPVGALADVTIHRDDHPATGVTFGVQLDATHGTWWELGDDGFTERSLWRARTDGHVLGRLVWNAAGDGPVVFESALGLGLGLVRVGDVAAAPSGRMEVIAVQRGDGPRAFVEAVGRVSIPSRVEYYCLDRARCPPSERIDPGGTGIYVALGVRIPPTRAPAP